MVIKYKSASVYNHHTTLYQSRPTKSRLQLGNSHSAPHCHDMKHPITHSIVVLLLLPMDSLRLGSSETFSSFPRKPLMVLNTLSRTDFSESTVSWQSAGRMRTATSDRRKYCCVAASASTPEDNDTSLIRSGTTVKFITARH